MQRGNEGAPPARPEDDRGRGGLPWGKIIAAVIGLLLLALIIPLACQALTGGPDEGSGGGQETTGVEQESEQDAGAGSDSGAEQQASGNGESTATEASGRAGTGGTGGEQVSGVSAGAVTAGFGAATGGAVGQVRAEGGVLDQTGDGTTVVIPRATISGTGGWMVVYRDEGGQPGDVIEVVPLQEGVNTDVTVALSEPLGTSQKLYAMIHANDPVGDTYTFPDGDPPVEVDGEPVVEAFRYTVGTLAAGEPMPNTGGPAIAFLPVVGGLVLMLGGLMLRWRAAGRG